MKINREFIERLDSELVRWPGVTYEIERNKHNKVHLLCGQIRRFVLVACSESDHRAIKNNIARVRRTLHDMGLVKEKL